jgi:hypothetical protein
MPTPAKLRDGSRHCRDASRRETEPHLKHGLICYALALAQLAEKIERKAAQMIKRDKTAA